MSRGPPTDSAQDPCLRQVLGMVTEVFVAADRTAAALDFAAIEPRAHEAGRKLARRLSEQAASRCAASAEREHPRPDRGRYGAATSDERPLEARDGPIRLEEARHSGPRCRRVFFPRLTAPGLGSPPL